MSKLRNLLFSYLFPQILGTVAAGFGIAGGLNSLFGGGGGGSASNGYGSGVPFYAPPQAASAAAGDWWNNLLNTAHADTKNLSGTVDPQLLNSLYQSLGINYGGLTQAGNQAGAQAGQVGAGDLRAGQQIQGQIPSILQAGFDPQNALFNQQTQQLTDQTNAAEASRGLGNSPVGASILSNTLGNFDINWQNNQLGRETQALGAAGTAAGQGATVAGLAPGYTYQSGQLPLQAYQTAAAAPGQAASTYSSELLNSLQPLFAQNQGLSQYLNAGNGAAASAYGAYSGSQNFNANQQALGAQGLMTGLTQLGNSGGNSWLNSLFSSGGGGNSAGGQGAPVGYYT